MRHGPLVALLLLTLAAIPPAQGQSGVRATLSLDVQADLSEEMDLRFDGLRRLTEYQGICLPEGATVLRVHDELGDAPHAKSTDAEGRTSITFRARGEGVTIAMERPAPSGEHAPFHEGDVNFCVPEGSRTTVRVTVPEGHELFFVGRGGTLDADGRGASVTRDGPLHAFYSYEAPLASGAGLALVEEAPFRLVVPETRVAEAREAAALAAPALEAAADEAGLRMPWPSLRVRYAPSTEFTWEAGHYGGHGLVTVRESSLDPDPREGYPYVAARVLVHEAFHALSAPYGRGDVQDTVDWWLEGTARHAERQVARLAPNATRHCERGVTEARCWDFDDRITLGHLDEAYGPGFTFQRRWSPSLEQSDDARSFYYRYSAYLVGAYVQAYGRDAYADAWARLHRAFEQGEGCPCGDGWLETVLVQAAGGIAPRDLYRPYGDLYDADRPTFEATVRPLVKDEEAFRDALEQAAGIGGGLQVPAPGVGPLAVALLALAALRRRRRPARNA